MLHLSRRRLPTRWRLALATTRRRGACATRATFSTTAATAFSIHPTTTILQLQTSAALSQPLSAAPGSCRSFSLTARWQLLNKAAYGNTKAKKAAKRERSQEAKGKGEDAAVKTSEPPVSGPPETGEPNKPEEPNKLEISDRNNVAGPKLAAMNRKNATTVNKKLLKNCILSELSPSEAEKIEKAVLEEIEAKNAKKATKQADMKKRPVKNPDMIPFGPFEDVIQPLALTLWGGKAEGTQKPPKLKYILHFLGPTCFWRVQIRSTRPKSENDLWKILWNGTRPGYVSPSEQERLAWIRKVREVIQHNRRSRPQERREINDKESDGREREDDPTGKAPPLEAEEDDATGNVPPLEAVVQDVFKRELARVAYEKASQQKSLEARNREMQKFEKEGEGWPTPAPLSYEYADPHQERLPFGRRDFMRHIDICGPIPPYMCAKQGTKSYIWTDMGGNVLANTFELNKIACTALHHGVNIWVWRGEYEIREMEAFMSPLQRPRLERIKEDEKKIRNWVLGRKGPPPKSAFVRKNDKERLNQLMRKSHVLRQVDRGWKKILEVVQREKSHNRFELPPYGTDGKISFSKSMPHPDRATIDAVWEPRITALRHADAIANYHAFLRRRIEAGILPAESKPKDSMSGEIVRGWTSRKPRKEPHLGDVAKRKNKALMARGWHPEDPVDAEERSLSISTPRRVLDRGNGHVGSKPAAKPSKSPGPLVRCVEAHAANTAERDQLGP